MVYGGDPVRQVAGRLDAERGRLQAVLRDVTRVQLLHRLGPRLCDEDIALLLCQPLDGQLQNQVVPLRLC